MSVLLIDSNSELWYTRADELGLKFISMPYTVGDTEYFYDLGKTYDFKEFFGKLRAGEKAITSALNPHAYVEIFEPILKSGQDILYVHFSSAMSGTFQFMHQAIEELKEKYPERSIKYVDTLNISVGAGLTVYEAALLHNKGASDDEVIEFVENFREHVCTLFTVDDLMFLKRGGRLSAGGAVFGTLLQIKPILTVDKEGKVVPMDKIPGRRKSIYKLAEYLKQNGENVADYPICIVHADCEDEAKILLEKVREVVGPDAEIWLQPIGPVIGTHCGPGTVGLIFHGKKRLM